MFRHTPARHPRPLTCRGRRTRLAAGCIGLFLAMAAPAPAQELVIGEQRIRPGIVFIFEGAVRDHVEPLEQNLVEDYTHVHIEARVNWAESGIPEGTPPGGFVPYLNIHALVINQSTREVAFVTLIPHINLIDNFHYARNMRLPGSEMDLYRVEFFVDPPDNFALARHRDWIDGYGDTLMGRQHFSYSMVDFREIVMAPPRQ